MRILLNIVAILLFTPMGVSNAHGNELDLRIEKFAGKMSAISMKSAKDIYLKDYWHEHQAAFRRNFPQNMHKPMVSQADKAQLKQLYSEIYNYLLVTSDPSALSFLETIYAKQDTNNWLEEKNTWSMHRIYLSLRQFNKAKGFRQNNPGKGLVPPPEIKDWASYGKALADGERPVINTVAGENFLELSEIDLSAWTGVVVVGHPRCPFFKGFIKSIKSDPGLANAFLGNTLWLTDASLTDGAVIKWNLSRPKAEFHYVVTKPDWPEINYWGSPSFYFFDDSKLVRKVVGWPRDESEARKAALKDSFQAIGIKIPKSDKIDNDG